MPAGRPQRTGVEVVLFLRIWDFLTLCWIRYVGVGFYCVVIRGGGSCVHRVGLVFI